MAEIDNEKFGAFLARLRREKGITQKELAVKLFISDKAVSKWERGLSMPDISLLPPLAEQLGVTITELLSGERIEKPEGINVQQVEKLVSGAIRLSETEERQRREKRRRRGFLYLACVITVALEFLLLGTFGYTFEQLRNSLFVMEGITLIFGGWFCFFVKETLPAYYDENKIHTYSDGFFRMNLAGLYFNNSNWPHILQAGRRWMLTAAVLFPIFYFSFTQLFPALWDSCRLFITLSACIGFFIPMYIAGKRYE